MGIGTQLRSLLYETVNSTRHQPTIATAPREKIQPLINLWDVFWKSLRPIANTSAQWLTWSLLIICLLAVVRAVGYTRWLAIHKVLAVVFLGLTLHCVRPRLETSDFMTPFGWWNMTVTLVGELGRVEDTLQ